MEALLFRNGLVGENILRRLDETDLAILACVSKSCRAAVAEDGGYAAPRVVPYPDGAHVPIWPCGMPPPSEGTGQYWWDYDVDSATLAARQGDRVAVWRGAHKTVIDPTHRVVVEGRMDDIVMACSLHHDGRRIALCLRSIVDPDNAKTVVFDSCSGAIVNHVEHVHVLIEGDFALMASTVVPLDPSTPLVGDGVVLDDVSVLTAISPQGVSALTFTRDGRDLRVHGARTDRLRVPFADAHPKPIAATVNDDGTVVRVVFATSRHVDATPPYAGYVCERDVTLVTWTCVAQDWRQSAVVLVHDSGFSHVSRPCDVRLDEHRVSFRCLGRGRKMWASELHVVRLRDGARQVFRIRRHVGARCARGTLVVADPVARTLTVHALTN